MRRAFFAALMASLAGCSLVTDLDGYTFDGERDGGASDAATDATPTDGGIADGTISDGASTDVGSTDDGSTDASVSPDTGSDGIVPPRQVRPMSTSIVTSHRPTLAWQYVRRATMAEYEVCSDPTCATPAATGSTTETSADVPMALTPGRHFWRVRAVDGMDVSDWSPIWQFTLYRRAVAAGETPGGTSYGSHLDLDGDAFDDIAIGANEIDRVHVYAGSALGPESIDTIFHAPDSADVGRFGISVATAGDVNGDGFGDLIVGACGPPTTAGADMPDAASCRDTAYVYHGGPALDTTTPTTRLAPPAGTPAASGFGYSVASAGDVDGDGYGDVVVGAYWHERVFVYRGGPLGLDTTVFQVLAPSDAVSEGRFGISVASGDVDGDGYSDVVVGRPFGGAPALFVFCGGTAGGSSPAPCARIAGPTMTVFGMSVSVGDFDGDGYPDIVGGGHAGVGAVQVFAGGPGPIDTTPDGTWNGETGSLFGISVAASGDFDGDGRTDVVVGAPGVDQTRIIRGGSESGSAWWGTISRGGTTPFGRFVTYGGRLNEDERADFVVGACSPNTGCANWVGVWTGMADRPSATQHWGSTGTGGFGLGANR